MGQEHAPYIVLVDVRNLRSAALQSLLEHWAEHPGLRVLQMRKAAEMRDLDPALCSLCIVDVGQASLDAVQTRVNIALVQTLFPEAPVAVVSDNASAREIGLATNAGLRGFIPAETEPEVFFAALELILRGGTYMPRPRPHAPSREPGPLEAAGETGDLPGPGDVAPDTGSTGETPDASRGPGFRLADAGVKPGLDPSSTGASLTPRQEDVLVGVRAGKSNKAIARDLELSEATIKIHVRQLMRKLGVSNRTQIAVAALRKDETPGERPKTGSDPGRLMWIRGGQFGLHFPS